MTTINELREKIRQLEKQLSERKTLDRGEVERKLWKFYDIIKFQLLEYSFIKGNIEKTASNILSLAYKPITKERIIEVLERNMCELSGDVPIAYADKIAKEILEER